MLFSLLMAAPPAGAEGGQVNPIMQFIPFIFMFVILYLLIIRPQRKRQKEMEEMINNLQQHDKVITTGGIIGVIVNIKKDKNTVVLKVDDTNNTKIEVQRNAIAGVIKPDA
jgi:preprotein translocase subunit YajC